MNGDGGINKQAILSKPIDSLMNSGATDAPQWPNAGDVLAWKRNKIWTGVIAEIDFPYSVTVKWDNGTGVTGTDHLTLKEFDRDWRIVQTY